MTVAAARVAGGVVRPAGAVSEAPPRLASERWGTYLVTAGLLLTCFSAHWSDVGVPVPLDRVLLVAGLGLSVATFLRQGGRLALRPVHLAIALALAWATISALSVGTLRGNGFFALLDRFGFVPMAIFVLAPTVYRTGWSRRVLARTFAAFGLYLGVTALTQMLGLEALTWPRYILDPNVGIHVGRARGPFVESVANGLMLTYGAAIASLVALTDRSRAWRRLSLLTLPLCAAGIVMTLTRAVWLGAAVGLVLAVCAVPRVRRRAPLLAAGAVGVVALAYVGVPGLADQISGRQGDQLSVWDRYNTNWAALRAVAELPMTGVGWHQSADRIGEFVRQGATYPVTGASGDIEIHSVFLSRLAELGIPGFVLWMAALGGAVLFALLRTPERPSLQGWRAVLLVVSAAWAVAAALGPLPYPQPNYLLWCLAGVVLADYLTARAPGRPARTGTARQAVEV